MINTINATIIAKTTNIIPLNKAILISYFFSRYGVKYLDIITDNSHNVPTKPNANPISFEFQLSSSGLNQNEIIIGDSVSIKPKHTPLIIRINIIQKYGYFIHSSL